MHSTMIKALPCMSHMPRAHRNISVSPWIDGRRALGITTGTNSTVRLQLHACQIFGETAEVLAQGGGVRFLCRTFHRVSDFGEIGKSKSAAVTLHIVRQNTDAFEIGSSKQFQQ